MKAFIVGTGRCGTSMLAQMLNSHSMICVPDEIQILFEYSNNGAGSFEIFNEKKNEYFEADDYVALIEAKCPHKFDIFFDYRSFFEKQQYPILDLKKLINIFYDEISETKNKKIFVDQTPWYGQRVDILNNLFPDAKYIHVVRDGRDVAISFARTAWWHNDIEQNLKKWQFEISQIIDSSRQILQPNQLLQVRYEDIVEQPEFELRRICSFLGVNFESDMLDPATYLDYAIYSKIDEEEISSAALNKWSKIKDNPTFKGSRYAWKKYADFDFSKVSKTVIQRLSSLGYQVQLPWFYCFTRRYLKVQKSAKKLISFNQKGAK